VPLSNHAPVAILLTAPEKHSLIVYILKREKLLAFSHLRNYNSFMPKKEYDKYQLVERIVEQLMNFRDLMKQAYCDEPEICRVSDTIYQKLSHEVKDEYDF
jgi:hypothetical protein